MRQRPDNFNTADGDPEATLVAPRFDDEEARRASPVVPLAEARASAPHAGQRVDERRGPRRSWTPALLAVALLSSFAVGGVVASKVFGPTTSNPPEAQAQAAVAPAQSAEVPAQESEVSAQVEPAPAAPAPREVADTKPEPRPTRVTRDRRVEDAQPRARDPRDEAARVEWEDSEDGDEDRRGRRERRRERHEDEAEKEMRKVLKRAKDKAPRLVDVLVSPRP
jgi:vacuolar-type H+-ATPase subunit H